MYPDFLSDVRDELAGEEDAPHRPYKLDMNIYPDIKDVGPWFDRYYLIGVRKWGKANAARYCNVLRWELKHRKRGENHPAWKGGKSFEPYCPKFNDEVKEKARERFGRRCFLCGLTELENKKRLAVHHVDYDKDQGCKDKHWQLVPLCNRCHARTNSRRDYWNKTICDKLGDHNGIL